jgi:hemolysin activation/secretion protein
METKVTNTSQTKGRSRCATAAFVITLALADLFAAGAADAAAAEPQRLAAAVIRGSTAYSPAELFPVYRDRLGEPIDRDSVQAIVTALQALYARDGYSRPQLSLDQQLLARGILGIEIFESRITAVTFLGPAGPYRDRLERLAAQLRDMQPVKQQDLQRLVRRMRELPGLSVAATTQREESLRNGYALVVETAFKPVAGEVRMNNRGTEEIGGSFASGQLVFNGLLGREEKVGLLLTSASDFAGYHGGGLFAEAPFGSRRTRLAALGFASRSNPREMPEDLPDLYRRERFTLRLSQPLQTAKGPTLSVSAALEFDNLRIDREELRLREDRLRVAALGASAGWRGGARTQYRATLEVRHGLSGLGSRLYTAGSAVDTRRADFLLARQQFVRFTQLNPRWSLRIEAFGQYSGHVLPYGERFKIGGTRLARGLEVAQIAGDRGAGARAELRRQLTGDHRLFGKTSVYGYGDATAAWKQDRPGSESASTAGTGLAFHTRYVSGSVELAWTLSCPDAIDSGGPSVFAELGVPF